MRRFRFAFAFILVLVATPAFAQGTVVDHWWTAEECFAAASAPYYVPKTVGKKPITKDEVVIGAPAGGCADMDLPKNEGGRGWIRVAPGTELVASMTTGKILRRKACDNTIHAFLPFPAEKPAPVQVAGPTVVVDTKPIAEAIAKTAKQEPIPQPFVVKIEKDERKGPAWYSWRRGSGKALVIGSAAAIVGAALCAKRHCLGNTQEVTVTNIIK